MDEFKKSMEGIWSSTVCKDTLDEAPMAYKDMSEIIANIEFQSFSTTGLIFPK